MSSLTSQKLVELKKSTLQVDYDSVDIKSNEEFLLLNEPKPTDEIFRTLGVPTKRDYVNKTLKDAREINVIDSLYGNGNPTFKGYHIKELCNKYFLSALSLTNLVGYLPEETITAIDSFSKSYDKEIAESSFYILAPREYFTESYYGKECKTYIILFREPRESSESGYATIKKNSNVTQVYSSGRDFSNKRLIKKHIDYNVYGTDGTSMLASNILTILLFLTPSIVFIFYNCIVASIVFGSLFIIINTCNNFIFPFCSDKYWNEKYIPK